MTKEAKRAAKTEKKLKILTGGYQVPIIILLRNTTNDTLSSPVIFDQCYEAVMIKLVTSV